MCEAAHGLHDRAIATIAAMGPCLSVSAHPAQNDVRTQLPDSLVGETPTFEHPGRKILCDDTADRDEHYGRAPRGLFSGRQLPAAGSNATFRSKCSSTPGNRRDFGNEFSDGIEFLDG